MILSVNPGTTPDVVAFGTVFALPVYARALLDAAETLDVVVHRHVEQNFELNE